MIKNELIEKIDAILPQTQCGQCGFPGCKPYAIAITEGRADINQCPPGDVAGIQQLADLLGIEAKPLNTIHGIPKPKSVAVIDENLCIGCTFCIQSCPVDAIVGAAKQIHTVIAAECTGCELCLAPCPVDCIRMIPDEKHINQTGYTLKNNAADIARTRYQFRLERLARKEQEHQERFAKKMHITKSHAASLTDDRKQAIIQAAIKRATAARAQAADKKTGIR